MKPESESQVQVTEIFHSIQGESSHAGTPCVFVRLTGCSLRCGYCDTKYAYQGGETMSLEDVVTAVSGYGTSLVEITGGEPLEQRAAVPLMRSLIGRGFAVMLETSGHVSLQDVPKEVVKIVDVKCPDSGEVGTFLDDNLKKVTSQDEFKFVISSREDYEWARDFVEHHLRELPNTVLFSPAHETLPSRDLSEWILTDRLPVRLQLQIHKYVWGNRARGV